MKTLHCLPMLLLPFFLACASQKQTTLESADYNQQKDQTDYTVLPFGSLSLPGKWEKGHFNTTSKQLFFHQANKEIAIAMGHFDKYEFNAKGEYKGWDFVRAFFEWESNYFFSKGLGSAVLVQDMTRNFMIYRVFDTEDPPKVDMYFLIGERNGNAYNISIYKGGQWTEEEKIQFLKDVFPG